jgi:hypothetical protein
MKGGSIKALKDLTTLTNKIIKSSFSCENTAEPLAQTDINNIETFRLQELL